MASKEAKVFLKEARDAIKNKDYQLAVKRCNEVLKNDSKNYLGLVLLGAAYQETNKLEAVKYLRKALSCTNDPTLAMQGLANCADDNELPDIYGQLLKLTPDKYSDVHGKLVKIASQLNDISPCLEILEKELYENVEDSKRIESAWYSISDIFMKIQDIPDKWNDLYEKSLEKAISVNDINRSEKYRRYLKLLYKLKKHGLLVEKACEMAQLYLNDAYPLEWICKVFSETALIDSDDFKAHLKLELSDIINSLLLLNSKSTLGLLAKGLYLFDEKQFIESRETLLIVNELQPNWNICLKALSLVHMKLRAYTLAEYIFRQLNSKDLLFAKSLVEQSGKERYATAIEICNELINNSSEPQMEVLTILAKAQLLYGDSNADKTITTLKSIGCEKNATLLTAFNFRLQDSLEKTLELLTELNLKDSDDLIELGEIQLELKLYEESLLTFLNAAKSDPFNSIAFYCLGKVYFVTGDKIRAKKCLQKCVSLNPLYEKAVTLLSSFYRTELEWDANLKLLENAVQYVKDAEGRWAWLQLGLHHLSHKSYDNAIASFRSALRYDSTDIANWEGLADAYVARGSLNSALKVYQKAIELNPTNSYSRLQVANIKTNMGYFREAIECYDDLFKDHQAYFPALKGYSEALLGLASNMLGQKRFGTCRDDIQKAVDYLTEAIKIQPSFGCLWRLMGKALNMAANLPLNRSHLSINSHLAGKTGTTVQLKGDELFQLSSRCFCRAIKINKENHMLWYELALNNYLRSLKQSNSENLKEILELANVYIKHAINLSPLRWQYWNLLGVISSTKTVNKLQLAQHCFIKAINLDKKSSISWTNLGVLFLLNDQVKLANTAFNKSQQSDTNYMNAWIGQAIIAERVGQGEEAMDLFRHCTQLGFHVEAAIGYTNWVCSTIKDPSYANNHHQRYAIEKMYAVPVALDSMTWYCNTEDVNASVESLCYLGCLYYREKLYQSAVTAFQKVAAISKGQQKDTILCNLGYSLLKSNRQKEATNAFQSISEATYKATIGLALSHFKATNYEESYSVYERVLQYLANNDLEKSNVLIAMSAMVYAFHGEKDAKTLLFQCISLATPPVEGLYSACALGILHQDTQLSQLVLQELKKYESNSENCHHVAFLTSQIYLMHNEPQKALNYLFKIVHLYPDRSELRRILSHHLLKYHKTSKKYLNGASRIAQSTIVLEMKNLKNKNSALHGARCFAIASEAMRFVDPQQQKLLAQKAVHLNPICKEAWGALIQCSV